MTRCTVDKPPMRRMRWACHIMAAQPLCFRQLNTSPPCLYKSAIRMIPNRILPVLWFSFVKYLLKKVSLRSQRNSPHINPILIVHSDIILLFQAGVQVTATCTSFTPSHLVRIFGPLPPVGSSALQGSWSVSVITICTLLSGYTDTS